MTKDVVFKHVELVGGQRATLAAMEAGEGKLKISISLCGKQEQFKKSTGRNISEGRLRKNVTTLTTNVVTDNKEDSLSYKLNTFSKGLESKDLKSIKTAFGLNLHALVAKS